jgi:hypothetical protein
MSESKPEVQGEDDSRTVHLVSTEGESFDVPLSVAKMSELVKTMITDDQDEEEAQEIPLPNVKTAILAKVRDFFHCIGFVAFLHIFFLYIHHECFP